MNEVVDIDALYKELIHLHKITGSNNFVKKQYREHEQHGPGGVACPCCNMYGCHPSNHKSLSHRRVRRLEKQKLYKKRKDYYNEEE